MIIIKHSSDSQRVKYRCSPRPFQCIVPDPISRLISPFVLQAQSTNCDFDASFADFYKRGNNVMKSGSISIQCIEMLMKFVFDRLRGAKQFTSRYLISLPSVVFSFFGEDDARDALLDIASHSFILSLLAETL